MPPRKSLPQGTTKNVPRLPSFRKALSKRAAPGDDSDDEPEGSSKRPRVGSGAGPEGDNDEMRDDNDDDFGVGGDSDGEAEDIDLGGGIVTSSSLPSMARIRT